jgi:hypothetical protein
LPSLNSLIMAVLVIPFALAAGKRGAIAGASTAVGIGLPHQRWDDCPINGKCQPVAAVPGGPALICCSACGRMILKVLT